MVIWGHLIKHAPEGFVHPDFEIWLDAPWALSIAAPNLTTRDGVERWQALFEFLADRYTREDRQYGHVTNFVVGNELNSGYIWNNMGRVPLDETVRQYERGLRIAWTALKKKSDQVHVLISLDNYWTAESAGEFGFAHYSGKGGFAGREYLWTINRQTKQQGDYPWMVAYHPYSLNMQTPVYWDQASVEKTPVSEDAPRLTPLNIEVLPQYLDRPELRFQGQRRDFYFTEQGYSSPHDDNYTQYNPETYDPDNLPEKWLNLQIAAYAYAYYKFEAIGAKANIFHRHCDVRSELLNIGIWARSKDGEHDYYKKKPIHEIVRLIDTEKSLEATTPYLKYLIIYPNTEPPGSWQEIIPNMKEH